MRAHHIMSRKIISVLPDASIGEAAQLMLANHISGLPVTDAAEKLVGILTERDFLRRAEIGTQKRRPRWMEFLLGPGQQAAEYVHAAGRKVHEVMTPDVLTVTEDTPLSDIVGLMERNQIKRVPVLRDGKLCGIVSRQNFVQIVASLARDVPDPTADDEHVRKRILSKIEQHRWPHIEINILVRNGVVDLAGIITDEHVRQAIVVAAENTAGVKQVHDHLCWVDPMSGIYFLSPEDESVAAKTRQAS